MKFPYRIFDNLPEDSFRRDCCICGERIDSQTIGLCDYAKTKRGSHMFFHRDCVRKWGER